VLTARLGLVTENAERALAIPHGDVLEERIRRCEDWIDRMRDVVLRLCQSQGLEAHTLGAPLPPRPSPDEGDVVWRMRYRERGVGPDDAVDDLPRMMGEVSIEQPVPQVPDQPIVVPAASTSQVEPATAVVDCRGITSCGT
jgi:hypothetical protein